jgi:hypothetical protein
MAMRTEGSASESEVPGGIFPTTHWSVVLAATDPQSPEAAAALEDLCAVYWYPLYAYVRHAGHTPEDSKVQYAPLAVELGTAEAALKMTVQRLRRRYGALLREEIARTACWIWARRN